jgi:hypothetical protein
MASPYQPGDRVYRYVLVGADRNFDITDLQPLTVIRVNRKTVTVKTDQNFTVRLPPQDIQGLYLDDVTWTRFPDEWIEHTAEGEFKMYLLHELLTPGV